VILLLGVALAVVLVVGELRRSGPRRGGRVAASIGAAAALIWIGLRPARQSAVPLSDALLVTAGATPDAVRHLVDSIRPAKVFLLPSAKGAVAGSTQIPDAGFLARHHPELGSLQVAGWGLTSTELEALNGPDLRFAPSPLPSGFGPVSSPLRVGLGEDLVIRGQVIPGPRSTGWVYLEDPGGLVDSARIEGRLRSGEAGRFVFRTRPREAGRWRYVLRSGPATIPEAAETLAVEVAAPEALQVLVLEGAPTFETRYLKTWLARGGTGLTIRSTVSRDRARFEFVNRKTTDLSILSALSVPILGSLDVVVTDARSLAALSSAERALLLGAIRNQGLGLLLVPDPAQDGAGFLAEARGLGFRTEGTAEEEERTVRLSWPGRSVPSQVPVPSLPGELGPRFAVSDVVRDPVGRVLAQVALYGAGRIGVTLVSEPSRWVLSGDHRAFAEYWSALLGAVARPPQSRGRLEVESGIPPRVDQPLRVRWSGTALGWLRVVDPAGAVDSIPLTRDPRDSTQALGVLWPRRNGWHRLGSADAARWIHVEPGSSWGGTEASMRLASTNLAVATRTNRGGAAGQAVSGVSRPLPLWPAFLLFAACAGYLWWWPRAKVKGLRTED
jgi:hypothetical protein